MTVFEIQTGNAVTSHCANTVTYPAILAGISVSKGCLKERTDEPSWLEKLFSFTKS